MPTDGRQSAYQYRNRRRQNQYDDDSSKSSDTITENSKSSKQTESDGTHAPRNKLMADAFFGTVAGRLAQEIHDEFLVCKICYESYTNPKCLACLHTFCASCIDRHISAEVTYNKYTDYRDFTCPLCRKRTQLPLGGVKRLPDNFLISGLTELVTRQRAPSHSSSSMTLTAGQSTRGNADGLDTNASSLNGDEEYDRVNQLPNLNGRRGVLYGECEICSQVGLLDRGHSTEPKMKSGQGEELGRASSAILSNAPQASSKCLDCNKLLCPECVKRHRNTKVTKDHATFDLQSDKNIECKEHPGESVRFYCEACSSCICVLCTFNEHREHEVESFGEAVACMRAELQTNLEQASRKLEHCQSRLSAVSELGDLVHSLERQIHETAEQFIEIIQKQEHELLHDLHEFIGSNNMGAIEQQIDQEHQLELAEQVCKEVSSYTEGQEIDLLLAKPELYSKIKQLMDLKLDESELDLLSSDVFFRPGTVQLGYLTNDLSGQTTEQYDYLHLPLSSSQSSIELANRPCLNTTSSQTDASLLEKFLQKGKNKEEKQFRCRACNTDALSMTDQETNTRPRGVNNVISFSGDASTTASEEFLSQLDSNKLDFSSMDNLTRARMRRKLREHYHTIDESTGIPQTFMLNGDKTKPIMSSNDFVFRRYSSFDRHH